MAGAPSQLQKILELPILPNRHYVSGEPITSESQSHRATLRIAHAAHRRGKIAVRACQPCRDLMVRTFAECVELDGYMKGKCTNCQHALNKNRQCVFPDSDDDAVSLGNDVRSSLVDQDAAAEPLSSTSVENMALLSSGPPESTSQPPPARAVLGSVHANSRVTAGVKKLLPTSATQKDRKSQYKVSKPRVSFPHRAPDLGRMRRSEGIHLDPTRKRLKETFVILNDPSNPFNPKKTSPLYTKERIIKSQLRKPVILNNPSNPFLPPILISQCARTPEVQLQTPVHRSPVSPLPASKYLEQGVQTDLPHLSVKPKDRKSRAEDTQFPPPPDVWEDTPVEANPTYFDLFVEYDNYKFPDEDASCLPPPTPPPEAIASFAKSRAPWRPGGLQMHMEWVLNDCNWGAALQPQPEDTLGQEPGSGLAKRSGLVKHRSWWSEKKCDGSVSEEERLQELRAEAVELVGQMDEALGERSYIHEQRKNIAAKRNILEELRAFVDLQEEELEEHSKFANRRLHSLNDQMLDLDHRMGIPERSQMFLSLTRSSQLREQQYVPESRELNQAIEAAHKVTIAKVKKHFEGLEWDGNECFRQGNGWTLPQLANSK